MRIGSLFAGIGGLELGLERAGLGETVWQVEIDPYCRAVLAKHWPNAERFEDVKAVGAATLTSVDLICGGFPCQDVSSAGKRAGLAGARSGLWYEYLRVVSELRPRWVVVENVTSGAAAWVDAVLEGLGEQGYACLPIPIAAADVGAPHERRRVFIVASNSNASREHACAEHAEVAVAPKPAANANGAKLWLEHGRAGGSCREGQAFPANDGGERLAIADFDGSGRNTRTRTYRSGRTEPRDRHWRSPIPDVCRVVHGVSRGLDKPSKRIAALGNSVVPQCAEVIGHVILELMR